MARIEKDFVAAGEARLEVGDVIRALRPHASDDATIRCRAIAQLLSGKDGWESASQTLGGAFAKGEPKSWLTRGKE